MAYRPYKATIDQLITFSENTLNHVNIMIPKYKVGDKLKVTQEFLDKTKWPYTDFDYITVDSFRSYVYHYDTPIIDGEYAKYYCISGHRIKTPISSSYHTGKNCFRFLVEDINILPLF